AIVAPAPGDRINVELSVEPSSGRLDLMTNDRSYSGNTLFDVSYITSADGGQTWSTTRVTKSSWDPAAYGVPCSSCANGVRRSWRVLLAHPHGRLRSSVTRTARAERGRPPGGRPTVRRRLDAAATRARRADSRRRRLRARDPRSVAQLCRRHAERHGPRQRPQSREG